MDQRRVYRIFNVLSRLRSPLGASKEEMARDFSVSQRTTERYIELIKDLGFSIEKENGRYKIAKLNRDDLRHEDLIIFTLEEAALIRDALISHAAKTEFQKALLEKLYALTDMEELSDDLYHMTLSKNINKIRKAIRKKKQVKLERYHSVNSRKISNRIIEPIQFIQYYSYVLGYEAESGKVKQFKTDRIGDVRLLKVHWKHEDAHNTLKTDLFGMSGERPFQAKLSLSLRAARLMEEEFPGTEHYIETSGNAYRFSGPVSSEEGIGRFVLGLVDEVEVISPVRLKNYIRDKIRKVSH